MNTKEAQIKAFDALSKGDIAGALAAKASSGQGWSQFDGSIRMRIAAMLDPTFQPKAFGGASIRPGIRVCAAALELWGESRISSIEGARRFINFSGSDPEDVMLMWSAGTEKARLREFGEAGITRVQVLASGCGDDAQACRTDAGKTYKLDDAPELPHCVDLEEEEPCRCTIIAKL